MGGGTPAPAFSGRNPIGPPAANAQRVRDDHHADRPETPATTCNGHSELCDRPYDKIAFPMTHNSFAVVSEGFRPGANANQSRTIQQQLRDGVRVFMLNTYQYGDEVMMCHGNCMLGMTPHLNALRIFESFLVAHTQEVITIIYEDFISPASAAAELEAAGLLDYVYAHEANAPWPTLGEMVNANERLVVLAENRGGRGDYAWYHDAWQLMRDTPYGSRNFSCELNRGASDNDLFLMNHWANTRLSLPSASNASVVNQHDVLMARANQCAWEAGRIPNFVAVDFYDRGDLLAVVDELNGVGPSRDGAGEGEGEAVRAHSAGGEEFSPE